MSSTPYRASTIALATLGALSTAAVAYAVYFDHRRRTDATFRRSLKKQHKRVSRAEKEEAAASQQGQKERVRAAVDAANAEGFPRDPEKTEEYFMMQVARGEQMCQDGSDPVDAALSFYQALKVYPQPRELINIYDKTVPKPILDILAEMIAIDSSISVGGGAGSAGGSAAGSVSGDGPIAEPVE